MRRLFNATFELFHLISRLFRSALRKLLNAFKKTLKWLIKRSPRKLQSYCAATGYPQYCAPNIEYVGNCFNTKYKIKGNTRYQIEINATTKVIPGHEIFRGLSNFFTSQAICIDVGANIGSYSIGMVGLGAEKVYALEPGPYFHRLEENVRLNSLENRIKTFKVGISETESSYFWAEDLNNPGNAHLISNSLVINTEETSTDLSGPTLDVTCLQLDEFVAQHVKEKIDYIKVDVELMELEVLRSGRNTIRTNRPILIVETSHDSSKMRGRNTVEEVFIFLQEEGYEGFDFRKNEFLPVNSKTHGKDTIFFPTLL